MDRCQGAIREFHTPMPFGNIVLMGILMPAGVRGFFLFVITVMVIMNVPEIPGMGMGRFHMGAPMVFI